MIRLFITGADVEIAYARAFAEIMPLRLIPTGGLHIGDESPWQPLADLFGTVGEPIWSIASAHLGATWPPTGRPMFAEMLSPGMRTMALVIGGNSAAKDAAALALYDAVIATSNPVADLLNVHGLFSRMIPPEASALRNLLTIEEKWTPETILSSQCSMT